VRPGWQTTEFWLSLATTTVTVAIALGLVAADDRGHIETAVVHGIEAIGALFAAAWVVVTYARERTEAKIPR
jgi:anti-sigma-K factor RskA